MNASNDNKSDNINNVILQSSLHALFHWMLTSVVWDEFYYSPILDMRKPIFGMNIQFVQGCVSSRYFN